LIGFTIYNFIHGDNPTPIWKNINYSEVDISRILSNFGLFLSVYPNVLSLELLSEPQKECKWNSGELNDDYVLAVERIGN
jgi:hypothetical protein